MVKYKFSLAVRKKASIHVQEAVDYYNSKRPKQGNKFLNTLKIHFNILKSNPLFEIRYGNVRCLPVKGYPYLIHFTVNETDKVVTIRAILHTSLNNPNLIG